MTQLTRIVLLATAVLATALQAQQESRLNSFNGSVAKFTDAGELIRPSGWRKWVYVGTPLTPHDMNDGKAAFPEFHNVYVDPASFAAFENTGKFPDGTQIVKELVLVGDKAAVSGNGYFMGEFSGLEVAYKDSVRFKDEPGNWAYFSFGHTPDFKYTETAKAFPSESCNSCHQASADLDYVFTQYYPVLRAALPGAVRMEMENNKKTSKSMDKSTLKAAAAAMGGGTTTAGDYPTKVFRWLSASKYANFAKEPAVHPSSSGQAVHGDVRVFYNAKLDASMKQNNKVHPVGSAAVKELYKDGTLIGWAASIKAREDDGKGNGWFWYEVLSTTDSSNPVAASLGNQNCVGCHAPGRDFIRSAAIK
jgi:mono/diheme cytochrome c family protein